MVSDGGNNTEKWPLEILFHVLTSDSPGSHIQNFTIGLSIGFGTTLAAFLFCYTAIKLEWIALLPANPELAKRLLKCLRMTATYEPAPSLVLQIFKSLGGKIQAAARQRPTTLMMLFAFQRGINEVMAGGTRKSRQQVLVDFIRDYNKGEKVRSCKINTDEIAAIRFLSLRDEAFINHLKVLWGADRIGNTAVPMNMPDTQRSCGRQHVVHATCAWTSRRLVSDHRDHGGAPVPRTMLEAWHHFCPMPRMCSAKVGPSLAGPGEGVADHTSRQPRLAFDPAAD